MGVSEVALWVHNNAFSIIWSPKSLKLSIATVDKEIAG